MRYADTFTNEIKEKFTVVLNEVGNEAELSWKARGVYLHLAGKDNTYKFSLKRISLFSKCGLDATRSAVKELEDFGYLERRRQSNGRMNYILYAEPKASVGKSHRGKTRRITKKDNKTNRLKRKNNKKEKEERYPLELFWKHYPRKVSKQNAKIAWDKLNDKDRCIAIKIIKKKPFIEINPNYIPYPASWINQRRWEDEIEGDQKHIAWEDKLEPPTASGHRRKKKEFR